MKFNFKENSLFAILLRSPWWYSFAIAMVLSLIASAMLPSNLKIAGAFGSFPFVIIGVMAFRRQARLPKAATVQLTLEHLQRVDWARLAPQLQNALTQHGYRVEPSPHPGADFMLHKDGHSTLLLARRFKSAQTGVEPLQALQDAAQQAGISKTAVLTVGGLSQKAAQFATRQGTQIWQAKDVAAMGLRPL